MPRLSRKPELLAPAGSLACLHAAVTAGADAVYLGLDEFNARRNADNFTLGNLQDACDYAHLRGVRVYVTMNVEILPSELGRATEYAQGAWLAGADALIVQDIGLAAELMRTSPQIAVHASTQMNTHNAAGIAAAAQLGAKRVTLARELSLAEITELAALAAGYGMEVECFAHGALCVCYSGQCLMSSMIGGRSANRGLCAQACRLPYELHDDEREEALPAPGEHLLSPRDLCTADLLDDLQSAGVASLKIEGRMKSPDYVFAVVSVYRELLDSGALPSDAQKARLAEAFSRGFTTAYLQNQRGNDIMSYGRPNNRGVFAGRVTRVEGQFANVAPEIELHIGDVLEFWTNRGHFAATLDESSFGKSGEVRVTVDQKTGKGDRVFRVRNAEAAFNDDAFEPRVSLSGAITLRIGQPAHIAFHSDGGFGEAFGGIVEAARTRAVSEADVREHVDRLGQTPFSLERLDVELDEGVGIGFSQIHRLRSEALDALSESILAAYADRRVGRDDVADQQLAGQGGSAARPAGNRRRVGSGEACKVFAWATNPSCARAAKKAGAEGLYVPVLNFRRGQAQLAGVRQDGPEQAGYPKQCVMALPTIDHDPVYAPLLDTREARLPFDLWDYVKEGKPVFADSLGDALRALECGARVEVGPHVPITNKASLQVVAAMGVERVWLSPELTLGQIADLAEDAPLPLGLFASGAQELMVTEHCLLMSQGPCAEQCGTCPRRARRHFLRDRKGFEFPVVTDLLGRSHLYNGVELDAVPNIPDLLDIGISAIMVDTTLLEKRAASDAVARAVRARDLAVSEHRALGKRAGATTGHLFRGVS